MIFFCNEYFPSAESKKLPIITHGACSDPVRRRDKICQIIHPSMRIISCAHDTEDPTVTGYRISTLYSGRIKNGKKKNLFHVTLLIIRFW